MWSVKVTPLAIQACTQVRIGRRPTVGPTLLKLVQPSWPEVGPTSEMITLYVHWREQLGRRRVPEMGRLRQNMQLNLVNNMPTIGSTVAQRWAN